MQKYQLKIIPINTQAGFILPATLWFLVVLSVFISLISDNTAQLRQQTRQRQLAQQALIEVNNTANILYYLCATHPFNKAGLMMSFDKSLIGPQFHETGLHINGSEIKLNNILYKGWGQSVFSVQDQGTLLSIISPNRSKLYKLLAILKVDISQRNTLIDSLLDYQDKDNLTRLNGAERKQYLQQKLPAPANRKLTTVYELMLVSGWKAQTQLWENNQLGKIFTAEINSSTINLNTAPREVLLTINGVTLAKANTIIANRPYQSLREAYKKIGFNLHFDPLETFLRPSSHLKINIFHPNLSYQKQIHIKLTPGNIQGEPWSIQYILELPVDRNLFKQTAKPSPALFNTLQSNP